MLAGVSVEYYAKLERGAIAGASSSVLDAVADALQLDDTERAHLLDLARAADGVPTSGRSRRRRPATPTAVRPSLHWALSAITDGIAFVRDPRQNLLAVNDLGRAFYTPVIGDGGRTPNLARFQFLDPASREFYPDWDRFAEMCVAVMRAEAGRDPHDRGLQDLVGELSTRSETFRNLWAAMTCAPTAPAPSASTTPWSASSGSRTKSSPSLRSRATSCSSTRRSPGHRPPSGCACSPRGVPTTGSPVTRRGLTHDAGSPRTHQDLRPRRATVVRVIPAESSRSRAAGGC